jgi:predicted Rossmann fold nucleotide-binding protein DprA/Smf involved in DNA uptake
MTHKSKFILFFLLLFTGSLLSFESMGQQEYGHNPQLEVREDFSDQELEQFIEANKNAMIVQQGAEQKMIRAIQDEGLDIHTFNDILTSKQNPNHESQASPEDHNKFDNAVEEVVKIQEEMIVEMESAIEDSGITIETYEEILIAYQQNPKVQTKINEMLNRSVNE